MGLPEQEVVKIMKEKMDRFNEDEELRLAAYNRELNIMAHEGELKEARETALKEGKVIGIKEGKFEEKIKFIQARYGQVDKDWLLSLNDQQLERINDIIFKEEDYETFKIEVEKGTD